jgi:molybdate transport system ATP-binding protein
MEEIEHIKTMRQQIVEHHPFITWEYVTLRIGETFMFHGTNWEIATNQHWAIIGPNGAGKSILANALCRTVSVVDGRILYYFDQSQNGSSKARSYLKRGEVLNISGVTQKNLLQAYGGYHQARWQSFEGANAPTVSELLTGENIEHISPYEISPLRTDESVYRERRQEAISSLGIAYLLNRKVLHISHGEGRKVLLARALMQRPKLLILDNPLCGLDTASRQHLLGIINDIISLNTFQVLLVVSREDEIPENITHIARVNQHQIVHAGSRQQFAEQDAQEASDVPTLSSVNPVLLHAAHQHADIHHQDVPFVEMRDVSVSYGDVQVLQEITWTMRYGEHWAIFGENGAGKSTLLSLILADNPCAYANDVSIFGCRRGSGESIWDVKRRIGWVAPELNLYYQQTTRCLSVVESGFFDSIGLYRRCTQEQAEGAHAWMEALGVEHLTDSPFGTISAGEQRLVLLARALVKSPSLLILDEPCQGLDHRHREHILYTLDVLCRHTRIHLIYVTHYWYEMPEVITHVLHLSHGQIRKIQPGKENFL